MILCHLELTKINNRTSRGIYGYYPEMMNLYVFSALPATRTPFTMITDS